MEENQNETPKIPETPTETTLGKIQDRFLELWEKAKVTALTPEEAEWMLKVQQDYWENPDGSLYPDK